MLAQHLLATSNSLEPAPNPSAGGAGGQPRLGRRRRRTPAEAAAARRQRVLAASAKMQAALSAPSSPRGGRLTPKAPKVRQAQIQHSAAAFNPAQPAHQLVLWLMQKFVLCC